MAGGVALNCVANSRLAREGPFEQIWVQPAAGDAGTALGAALHVAAAARRHGRADGRAPPSAGGGQRRRARGLAGSTADVAYERPSDIADAVAEVLAADGIVAWFQGRSEYGPRALGHRSLLADPRTPGQPRAAERRSRAASSSGPVAPMVLLERAGEIFDGPLPSPYMLFTHRCARSGASASRRSSTSMAAPASRRSTARDEPLVAAHARAFERRTGVPVVVNTSLNTAGRPMVDDPRDALECFGSAPVDVLALGPVPDPQLAPRAGVIRSIGRRGALQ